MIKTEPLERRVQIVQLLAKSVAAQRNKVGCDLDKAIIHKEKEIPKECSGSSYLHNFPK